MNKIKSGLNWAGNKYRYVDIINELVKNKRYRRIYDLFLGSGNILININCHADKFVGNDIIQLVPIYFKLVQKYRDLKKSDIDNRILIYYNFIHKYYYKFRDDWNTKYLNKKYDKIFLIDTILLLKMCSNSMVRFNKKNEFNQGYRHGGKSERGFFKPDFSIKILNQLKILSARLLEKKYFFCNLDTKDMFNNKILTPSDLLILDPPYILSRGIYNNQLYTEEIDIALVNFLEKYNGHFIYFNFISKNSNVNKTVLNFIQKNKLKIIQLRRQAPTGQKRVGMSKVDEVIITNIY